MDPAARLIRRKPVRGFLRQTGAKARMTLVGVAKNLGCVRRTKMRVYKLLALAVVVAAVAGCTTAPIMNVTDAPVAVAAGKPVTQEQVRGAIVRAGSALGWQMKDEGPSMMVGTLVLRTHTAVVEIPYSTTSYSIKYRSSINLDESGGSIHKNYNGWIQNLNRGINTQLAIP
jgi:hypothetical protein